MNNSRREIYCELAVRHTWRGELLADAARVNFALVHDGDLRLEVDAPTWSGAAPPCAPGRVAELWRYDVAELFILGGEDRYLELELGPRGHWWLLELRAWRRRLREDLECEVRLQAQGARWRASVRLPEQLLPARPWRLSACAIWGDVEERCFAMSHPTRGERPDFHQASAFGPEW